MATKDSRLTRAGVSGYNKPKRTPDHPTQFVLGSRELLVLLKALNAMRLSKLDTLLTLPRARCLRLGGPTK